MKIRLLAPALLALYAHLAAPPAGAEWSWRYPKPQGHTLYDVVFLDDETAIAVGENGTIIATHNAGDSWAVQSKVFTIMSFKSIDRVDANTAVAVGESGIILRTDNQGATWSSITSDIDETLNDVSFFDATHGIAVAWNTVLRSSDGGLTWQKTTLADNMLAVDMISATDAVALGEFGGVQYTNNGGATWTPGVSPIDPAHAVLLSLDFIDPLHGVVAHTTGEDQGGDPAPARCYVTADGGATWSPSTLNNGNSDQLYFPREILYPQIGEVLIAGRVECCKSSAFDPWPFGNFETTVNDGGVWAYKRLNRSANGLAYSDAGLVIVVGEDGRILRHNLDASYNDQGPPHPHMRDGRSSFVSATTGIVFSSDATAQPFGENDTHFARTTDGGLTWATSRYQNVQCLDATYLSPDEIIAVGVNFTQGIVLRSINGGASWSPVWTGAAPAFVRSVVAVSPTRAVAVGSGDAGLVIEGEIVTQVDTDGWSLSRVASTGGNLVVAVGATDARSTDGGDTWSAITTPATEIRGLDFASSTRAFGVGMTGVLTSDDNGDTWAPNYSFSGLRDISFTDENHGMAVGDNGNTITTRNGGATWTPVETPTRRTLNCVTMVAPDRAYASGLQQILFAYSDHLTPTLIRSLDVAARPFGADLRWDVTIDEHLSGFTIRRSSGDEEKTVVAGLATSARSYHDDGLVAGRTYEYQLLAVDKDGSFTQSAPVTVTIPKARVELFPNQPNPFNPVTTIQFVVPERMPVQLAIHDVAGRVVATLADDVRDAGRHSITWNADGIASGVYFAKLRAGKTEVSRKMVLLK